MRFIECGYQESNALILEKKCMVTCKKKNVLIYHYLKNPNTWKLRALMSSSSRVILMKMCTLIRKIFDLVDHPNNYKKIIVYFFLFLLCKSCFSYTLIALVVKSENKWTWTCYKIVTMKTFFFSKDSRLHDGCFSYLSHYIYTYYI